MTIPHKFTIAHLEEVVNEFTTESIEFHTAVQNIVDFYTQNQVK